MNILYLVHQNSWVEFSGTPILTQQYADIASKKGNIVCVLTPSNQNEQCNKILKKGNIYYLKIEALNDWSNSVFRKDINKDIDKLNLPFKPDVIHIIDWVNFNPTIKEYLKKFRVPIIRHINSFEDFCYFIHPIYRNIDNSLCNEPLTISDCSQCISNKIYSDLSLSKKIKFRLFNSKNKDLQKFKNILSNRDKINEKNFLEIYDHLIFGSESFSKYFFSHIKYKKDYSIVKHGVDKKKIKIKNLTNRKINIIYTGGRSFRKGWKIVENSFNYILNKYPDEVNFKLYGDKKKLQKSKISKYKNVEFNDFFEYEKLQEKVSWADIAVLPTLFEPYGIIIREFLSLGVVPITTNSFGPSEVVNHKLNGIILKQPYTQNLINEIEKIIKNKYLIHKYVSETIKTKIPTKEEEFEKIEKIYKNCLKKNQINEL